MEQRFRLCFSRFYFSAIVCGISFDNYDCGNIFSLYPIPYGIVNSQTNTWFGYVHTYYTWFETLEILCVHSTETICAVISDGSGWNKRSQVGILMLICAVCIGVLVSKSSSLSSLASTRSHSWETPFTTSNHSMCIHFASLLLVFNHEQPQQQQ